METPSYTETTPEKDRARSVARAQFEQIKALVDTHAAATNPQEEESARVIIRSYSPHVAIRSNWHAPGDSAREGEYRILLCAGTPTVQIIGDLEEAQPYTARLGYQDWFTRWEEYPLTEAEEKCLLDYARFFDFGS